MSPETKQERIEAYFPSGTLQTVNFRFRDVAGAVHTRTLVTGYADIGCGVRELVQVRIADREGEENLVRVRRSKRSVPSNDDFPIDGLQQFVSPRMYRMAGREVVDVTREATWVRRDSLEEFLKSSTAISHE